MNIPAANPAGSRSIACAERITSPKLPVSVISSSPRTSAGIGTRAITGRAPSRTIRNSSFDQNPERQLEHVQVDRLFTDKASGKDTQRPELERLLAFAREGDTVVVHSMDRLARNLDDLRLIVQKLTKRGVRIEFVKENLTFTGEDSPLANLILSVMGAFAEFERALIRERQREGIALAKQRGAYRGRKKSLSPEQTAQLRQRVQAGERKAPLAREFGISRETLYQYLRTQD